MNPDRARDIQPEGQQLAPERALQQARAVIALHVRLGFGLLRPHPGIGGHQAKDPQVLRGMDHGCGGAVAESPQHDAGQPRPLTQHCVDRCTDVVIHAVE